MGCGASKSGPRELLPPMPHEMPEEPLFDLPLWNEQSRGKLKGQLTKQGKSGFNSRYKMQKEKLFLGSLADKDNLDKFSEVATASIQAYAPMLRKLVNWQHKTSLEKVVIDANAFIGDRNCALRPGYCYENSALEILISKPTKAKGGPLPGIVLASPIGVDGTPVELYDWYGRLMSGSHQAVVFNMAFRPGRPETPLPAGMLDMLAGLKYMVARADELGIDKSRIAIACQSSGAHVACPLPLELAARGEASLVKLVIMESPGPTPFGDKLLGPYNEMPVFFRYCTETVCKEQYIVMAGPEKWEDRFQERDPILHVHHAPEELLAKMPKHIIFSAEFDDFRMTHEEYATKLLKCGVLLDFMILPGGSHQDVCGSMFAKRQWNLGTIKKYL
eukprot:CAMPEP_0174916570 /NCGR_PEP_ID=MMETSP1355-20121228/1886_1 /TAXON_ID=464990 /ORGANISM="Hemiselmis tepida, Strain CCMP443" /LENGTH=388 /DNA_ID=CAMNT_0016161579 /DNA_START=48 /DNA_END=1214 /DNA_ORIENTATION=-